MKYPKILLTGGTGQVGYELKCTLKNIGEVWAPARCEFDLADPESLRVKIGTYEPNLIVNCAAYTSVDDAESEPELALTINAEAPRVMAEEAHKLNIPLIHYSTDYVFDGNKLKPYIEKDQTKPLNTYGKTKLKGELGIKAVHEQHLILRTSWIYSPIRGNNFYCTMMRLFQEHNEIHVVNDQIGNPTSVKFIAERTLEILRQMKTRKEGETRWGLYHLTQNQTMSRYEFAKKILEQAKESSHNLKVKSIKPISSEQFKTIAKRPKYSVCSNHKINDRFKFTNKKFSSYIFGKMPPR